MHVVFAVEDVERSKRFYDDAFGWQPHLEWPDEYAELVLPNDDWGHEAAYFADPDGHIVAVARPLEQ